MAIYVSIIAAMIYFAIWPAMTGIKNMRAEIIDQKIDLEKKITREKNMSELSGKLKKMEPQLETLNNIFINQNRELEFITTLENIAQNNGIIQKISFSAATDSEKQYKTSTITINADGTFANLLSYLSDLEKMKYYLNVKALNISASATNKEQDQKNLTLNISADTFWR